ncbi:MAG: hypothetical protein VKL01_00450 [Limnothrix sp.]|uniref:hypothetical protein n=1 Tax=unclassified Limnothrix TaxID=2632864 RepID=UPI00081DE290|nr:MULTISPECIES: hypothetical protein [unclassified Limnothrix]MEB3116805.1 hypothetical protein [Limnothrix sp.]OCQ90315.1 hypothetical protein BCR12_15735 [Limnothrix sp. P13C2]RFP59472.1 MAG: hypothetical protein BJG00_009370 [Limnothrix sp. CACIAM 69d]MBD2162679.1 hypothetical protein [Limnothrix sp. FACHB-1083]MBD2193751.1 hypothetical protein [Limnothrix sp. FACHB-1088]
MKPLLMRQLWSVVESIQTSTLLALDDDGLVNFLADRLMTGCPGIDRSDRAELDGYLQAKVSLIRDLANGRSVA